MNNISLNTELIFTWVFCWKGHACSYDTGHMGYFIKYKH